MHTYVNGLYGTLRKEFKDIIFIFFNRHRE